MASNFQGQGERHQEKDQVNQQRGLAVPEAKAQNRQVQSLREAGNGVLGFGAQLPANKYEHENRHQRDRQQRRKTHRQSLGPGQWPEHTSFLGFQKENREERNQNDNQRKEEGGSDLFRGPEQDAPPFPLRNRRRRGRSAGSRSFRRSVRGDSSRTGGWTAMGQAGWRGSPVLRKLPITVFHHHDRGIHQHTDRQRKASERHDVGTDVEEDHGDEACQNGNGKSENGNQSRAKVEKEDDDHQADDGGFFQQVALQGLDRSVNEP